MKNNMLVQAIVVFLLAATITCITGCTESTFIGEELIEDENFLSLNLVDTFTIKVKMIEDDSVQTAPIVSQIVGTNGQLTEAGRAYLLGSLNDPVFGQSSASIYSQFLLRQSNIDLGENLTFDSLVLALAYVNEPVYGDSTAKTSIYVHEVLEKMDGNKVYYADQDFTYSSSPIATKENVTFTPSDSLYTIVEESDTTYLTVDVPQLRVRLNDDLGERLLSQSGTSTFKNNNNFLSFFKGLHISSDPSGNSVAYFNLRSEATQLILYYSVDTIPQSLSFFVYDNAAAINHYDHQYSNTISNALQMSYPNAQEVVYAQGLNGVGFQIEIPYLKELGNVIINKAELELFTISDDLTYASPQSLSLFAVNQTENNTFRIDNSDRATNEDGTLIDNHHLFSASFYSQEVLADENDGDIQKIFIGSKAARADRAIIAGPNHPDPNLRMKFRVYYTSID